MAEIPVDTFNLADVVDLEDESGGLCDFLINMATRTDEYALVQPKRKWERLCSRSGAEGRRAMFKNVMRGESRKFHGRDLRELIERQGDYPPETEEEPSTTTLRTIRGRRLVAKPLDQIDPPAEGNSAEILKEEREPRETTRKWIVVEEQDFPRELRILVAQQPKKYRYGRASLILKVGERLYYVRCLRSGRSWAYYHPSSTPR